MNSTVVDADSVEFHVRVSLIDMASVKLDAEGSTDEVTETSSLSVLVSVTEGRMEKVPLKDNVTEDSLDTLHVYVSVDDNSRVSVPVVVVVNVFVASSDTESVLSHELVSVKFALPD